MPLTAYPTIQESATPPCIGCGLSRVAVDRLARLAAVMTPAEIACHQGRCGRHAAELAAAPERVCPRCWLSSTTIATKRAANEPLNLAESCHTMGLCVTVGFGTREEAAS